MKTTVNAYQMVTKNTQIRCSSERKMKWEKGRAVIRVLLIVTNNLNKLRVLDDTKKNTK